MQDVDVLIIGGGPTGVTLALELAMQKVSFRIIDKETMRSDKSRALVVQSRTLELLSRHDIARELIARGQAPTGVRFIVNKKLATQFDWKDLDFHDTAFPTPLFISQADTERFLDEALLRYGHEVERPYTAEKLEQDDTGVSVLLRGADGIEQQVRCKFVVGCDGAHSIVRHSAHLNFEGAPYDEDFILADVHLKWDQPSEYLSFFMGQGILAGFPLKDGVFRLVCSRPGGLANNEEPTLKDFQEIFERMAPGKAELVDPVWISRFRLHHRCVDQYRAGRMFVAGDAAHIHSPAGGQGMNTGMQDAVNLGWKLARVLRGEKDDSLLDSYNTERLRVGQHLLRTTDRGFKFGANTNPIYLVLRNLIVPWVLPWMMGDRTRRTKLLRFVSELGIRYRTSPIVGSAYNFKGKLQGGDRAPDGTLQSGEVVTTLLEICKGPMHNLILLSGSGSEPVNYETLEGTAAKFLEANPDWVKVRIILKDFSLGTSGYIDKEGEIHTRYGFTEPGYVLVRPDYHIAHIGPLSAMDELLVWVTK
jgi:2-polyprenyl-6-methoxyphenol hydroxylase-like FAD-dependent oxidoreductase